MAIETVCDYTDEQGNLIFQSVRLNPKGFYQRQKLEDGTFQNNLDGLTDEQKHTLYGLPEVVKALSDGQPVYFCEGEKDVETVRARGLTATCNAGGSGKMTADHVAVFKRFKGSRAVIFADNDDAGRSHAELTARLLNSVYCTVKIVEFPDTPPKGDITDWLHAGHTKKDLSDRIKSTQIWTPPQSETSQGEDAPAKKNRLTCMSDYPSEEVGWLLKPYIPLGKLTLIVGDPGQGKTFAMAAIAAACTNNQPINGVFLPQGSVIYQSAEDGVADTLRPRFEMVGADVSKVFIIDESEEALDFSELQALDDAMDQIKPKIVIFDPIQGYLGAGTDMHRANEVRPLLSRLGNLAAKHGTAVIAIMHMNKSGGGKAIYRGLGSIDLMAAARSALLVGSDPADQSKKAIIQIKSSLWTPGAPLGFSLSQETGFKWTGISSLTEEKILGNGRASSGRLADAENELAAVLSSGELSASEAIDKVTRATGCSEKTVRRAKKNLGVASRPKFGSKGVDNVVWLFANSVQNEVDEGEI